MQCHLDYLNLNFHCLSLNSLPLTPNNKRNSHVVFVHRRHLNFSFIFHHKMALLNSFCSMVIGRSLSAFKIDELSTNFLICDHTSFNCGRSKFLAKLNDEDMIISNMWDMIKAKIILCIRFVGIIKSKYYLLDKKKITMIENHAWKGSIGRFQW